MAILRNQTSPQLPSKKTAPKLRLYRNDSVEFEDGPSLFEDQSTSFHFVYPDLVARHGMLWFGLASAFYGSVEYVNPGMLGNRLTTYYSGFYLFLGALLLVMAASSRPRTLLNLCGYSGAFLALIGGAGFLLGTPSELVMPGQLTDRFSWVISPGNLEFGTLEHLAHLVAGVSLLTLGVRSRRECERRMLNF